MSLHLTFTGDGRIEGEGVDDIAPFVISGGFDVATGVASWTKAYIGMHRVEYSGVYCQRAICGDWTLVRLTGGFWIWPCSTEQWESAAEQLELQKEMELV